MDCKALQARRAFDKRLLLFQLHALHRSTEHAMLVKQSSPGVRGPQHVRVGKVGFQTNQDVAVTLLNPLIHRKSLQLGLSWLNRCFI